MPTSVTAVCRLTLWTIVMLICAATTAVAGGPQVVLELPPTAANPRNSEGDLIQLKDGSILYVYTHFTAGAGDHATAHLAARRSTDDGRTWSDEDTVIVANEGDWNIMSVSLLRLHSGKIALAYIRKNSLSDCRPLIRFSSDEARTWSQPIECITDQVGYYVLNNDRLVQLGNSGPHQGRLILPVALHKLPAWEKPDWNGDVMCYLSDDEGKTWRRSRTTLRAHSPAGRRWVTQEPGVVELKDGRLMLYARSNAGCQLVSYSSDGGDTWSAFAKSSLIGPVSPATIERIPGTGELLAVWNDQRNVGDEYRGKRTPYSLAISRDEGTTWTESKTLFDSVHGWYCYSGMLITSDYVLLGHCAGDRRKNNGLAKSQVTRVPMEWLLPNRSPIGRSPDRRHPSPPRQ